MQLNVEEKVIKLIISMCLKNFYRQGNDSSCGMKGKTNVPSVHGRVQFMPNY